MTQQLPDYKVDRMGLKKIRNTCAGLSYSIIVLGRPTWYKKIITGAFLCSYLMHYNTINFDEYILLSVNNLIK